jgi:hypothetical protein
MGTKVIKLALLFVAIVECQSVSANLVVANPVDFSGLENIIDFNNIANTKEIKDQFANDFNVTFNGLVGLTNSTDINRFNGSTIASNWIYPNTNIGPSWTATFTSTQNIVGFLAETNTNDNVSIEAFLGGSLIGSVNFKNPNGVIPDFLAIQSILGFDQIKVTTGSQTAGFFAMDDFKFQSNTVVPLPGAIWLFGSVLIGIIGTKKSSPLKNIEYILLKRR